MALLFSERPAWLQGNQSNGLSLTKFSTAWMRRIGWSQSDHVGFRVINPSRLESMVTFLKFALPLIYRLCSGLETCFGTIGMATALDQFVSTTRTIHWV